MLRKEVSKDELHGSDVDLYLSAAWYVIVAINDDVSGMDRG